MSWPDGVPTPYDEQMSGDRGRSEREEINKTHDSGEQDSKDHDSGECDPNWKNCEYAKPNRDNNGHFDEIWCCYINNELNFCGVPCPRTKGEE